MGDLLDDGLQSVLEVLLDLLARGVSLAAHPGGDLGVVLPASENYLVATHVQEVVGEESSHFRKEAFHNLEGEVVAGVQRDVVDVCRIARAFGSDCGIAYSPAIFKKTMDWLIAYEEEKEGKRPCSVPGNIELRENADASLQPVLNNTVCNMLDLDIKKVCAI